MTVVYKHVARPGIDIWQTWKSIGTTPDGETAYAEVVALEAGSIGAGGSGGSGGVVQQGAVDATVQPWQVTGPLTDTQLRATPVPVSGPLTDTQLRATPVPVSGTFFQATQPVSGTFWQATQPVSGTFWQATQPVSGTFWQATQPVSGTVTANIGTSGSLALDATLTGGTQKSKLVDTGGTNVASVSAAGALKVDNSGVTQPVSGTVTANIGTSGSLALDATLTGGTQKSKLVDTGGTNVAAVSAAGRLSVDASGVAVPITDNAGSLTIDSPAIPTTAGAKTSANSLGVVLASDQAAIPTTFTQPALVAGTAEIGRVGLSKTGTGYSAFFADVVTTAVTPSAAAGKFGGVALINLNATPAYLQVFDTTGAVTLGTTVPTFVIPIPANSTAANGSGIVFALDVGIAIANGIKVAATTGAKNATTVTTGLSGTIYYA